MKRFFWGICGKTQNSTREELKNIEKLSFEHSSLRTLYFLSTNSVGSIRDIKYNPGFFPGEERFTILTIINMEIRELSNQVFARVELVKSVVIIGIDYSLRDGSPRHNRKRNVCCHDR